LSLHHRATGRSGGFCGGHSSLALDRPRRIFVGHPNGYTAFPQRLAIKPLRRALRRQRGAMENFDLNRNLAMLDFQTRSLPSRRWPFGSEAIMPSPPGDLAR